MESLLAGKPEWGPDFINAFFRRVWVYLLLPLVFAFTGVGLALFPNSTIQRAWGRITKDMLDKSGPDAPNIIEALQLDEGTVTVIAAIVISIVLISLVRLFAVTYNPAIVATTYFSFLGAVAIMALMLQADFSEKFIRILIDYLTGNKFLTGIVLVGVGTTVGLFTEGILARMPIIGMAVGQRPGEGSYVCKTCQTMQYIDNGNSPLAPCQHGRCRLPIFRKLS